MDDQKLDMSPVVKMVLPYAMLAILALIVLWYLKKKLGQATDSFGITTSQEEKNVEKSRLDSVKVDPKKLLSPDSRYKDLAGVIYIAMKGAGTDDTTVKQVLNAVKNQSEWNAVIKNFGVKDDQNLMSWLRTEFNEGGNLLTKYGTTNQQDLDKILKSKGITQNLIYEK